jgi:hypothetical protein
MSFINHKYRVCPLCEGYGKKINYFDLPEDEYLFSGCSVIKIKSEKVTKDGYHYNENELCPACQGVGVGFFEVWENQGSLIYKYQIKTKLLKI